MWHRSVEIGRRKGADGRVNFTDDGPDLADGDRASQTAAGPRRRRPGLADGGLASQTAAVLADGGRASQTAAGPHRRWPDLTDDWPGLTDVRPGNESRYATLIDR